MSATEQAASAVIGAETLGDVHIAAERGARPVVVGQWEDGQRMDLPPWRFYRSVIRIGLYLWERARLRPGDRVVSIAPVSSERFVLEWAAMAQGGVSVALDPSLRPSQLASALRALAPRIVVVAGRNSLKTVRSEAGIGTVLSIDGSAAEATPWAEAIELGGTLDTAERAQSFRARARQLEAGLPALGFPRESRGDTEPAAFEYRSHGEVLARIRDLQSRVRPANGDVAYVVSRGTSIAARLALLAFAADGRTSTFVGTPGRHQEEIDEVQPTVFLGPRSVLSREDAASPSGEPSALRRILARTAAALRGRPSRRARPALKAILTEEGPDPASGLRPVETK